MGPPLASLNTLKDRASAEAGSAHLSQLSTMRAEGLRGPRLLSVKVAGHAPPKGRKLLERTASAEEQAGVNGCEHVKKVSTSKS